MREGSRPSSFAQLLCNFRLPPNQQELDVKTGMCAPLLVCAIQWVPLSTAPLCLCLRVTLQSGPSSIPLFCPHTPIIRPLVTPQAFNRLCEAQSEGPPCLLGGPGMPSLPQSLRCPVLWVLGARRVRQAGPRWLSCAEGSRGRKLQ